ncbi:MAG: hypothetical protein QM594_19590 [Niabella sp.]
MMNHKLTIFFFLLMSSVNVVGQSNENFDGVPVDGSGNSQGVTGAARIINSWSFSMLQANGNIDPDSFIDITNNPGQSSMANGSSDKVAYCAGYFGTPTAASAAVIKTTSGNSFKLVSFRIESGDGVSQSYRVLGYKDDVFITAASQNFIAPFGGGGALITLTDAAWDNIDEFRIVRQDGSADVFFYMDDITVDQALPVTFGGIVAEVIDNRLMVNWSTLTEKNNDHFDVEMSLDGKTFKKIHTVQSKAINGSSDVPISYSLAVPISASLFMGIGILLLGFAGMGKKLDRNKRIAIGILAGLTILTTNACSKGQDVIPGMTVKDIYLRIAQVDKDGERSYSKTVKLIEK